MRGSAGMLGSFLSAGRGRAGIGHDLGYSPSSPQGIWMQLPSTEDLLRGCRGTLGVSKKSVGFEGKSEGVGL